MAKLFECPACNSSQLSLEKLKEHCLKIHGKTLKSLMPIECGDCGHDLKKIPNVADVGISGNKWDGITKYQCINEECDSYEEIIVTRADD